MNANNVKMMAAAAVVIVICLLFSWVQYGGDSGDDSAQDDSFEGVWYPVYTYNSGITAEITAPEQLTASVADGVVSIADGESTLAFPMVSDCEAVSERDGVGYQLYLEDGTLYLITIFDDRDMSGIVYMAMSRDSTATLPSDKVDLSGTTMEMAGAVCNGVEFNDGGQMTFAVDSHAFHVAKGTIVSENRSYEFTGFVKSDGSRSVIIGCCTGADGSTGTINAVVEGGEGAFSFNDGYAYMYGGQTSGMTTGLVDGTIDVVTSVETLVFEVDVEGCLANVMNELGYFPGAVMWTLGDDCLLFGHGSVAAFDGSEYVFVLNNMVA